MVSYPPKNLEEVQTLTACLLQAHTLLLLLWYSLLLAQLLIPLTGLLDKLPAFGRIHQAGRQEWILCGILHMESQTWIIGRLYEHGRMLKGSGCTSHQKRNLKILLL